MRNPFLKNYRYLFYYILAWVAITITQAGILHYFLNTALALVLQQSFLCNISFATIALIYWNMIRFIHFDKNKIHLFAFNQLALLIVFFLIWVILSEGFCRIGAYEEYTKVFREGLPFRLFTGALIYICIILLYYILIYYNSFQEKLDKESALYRVVKDTELQLLKSQLHPHFLFNSLNSMNALMITDVAGAQNMLLKLSEFLRKSLDINDHSTVFLEEELAYGRLYLDIEKVRFGERLIIEEKIDPLCLKTRLPHLLLQPLYENVIKHGLGQSLGKVFLTINTNCTDNYLHVSISNNYEQRPGQPDRKGIGIRNVQKRLSLHYGRKDCFQLHDKDEKFEIVLSIPQTNQI